ncbi:MAG: hypothetical protein IKS98_08200 [Lachnospiraceae bacterium]|nr:hypothetical protein [Lachnospiraceae bacterium]
MEELLKRLETACWAFYHIHKGTADHLSSMNRCYELADKLQHDYGVSNETLVTVCERAIH